ncbi:nuclear transport factor 2 family protein [bacterium SCSIO 12643]|nr:nuclear transport factor 2 family protein [bacterium SCSIO 12643]
MDTISKELILKQEEILLDAMRNSDLEKLEHLLHDDLLFIIPTGQTVTKEMDLANLKSGNLKIQELQASEHEVSLVEDCALVSVYVELKGQYLGQPIAGQFKYFRNWKLVQNQWKVIGGAGVQINN